MAYSLARRSSSLPGSAWCSSNGAGAGAAAAMNRPCCPDSRMREARCTVERASSTEDRKSTRLNSSHGYISYAVFCLKKKKTTASHLSRSDPLRLYRSPAKPNLAHRHLLEYDVQDRILDMSRRHKHAVELAYNRHHLA